MITDRHRRAFELTVIHKCNQTEAGKMLDPPCSQQNVSDLLKEVYATSPELEAIKIYFSEINPNPAKNPPSSLCHYDESMDSTVKAKF